MTVIFFMAQIKGLCDVGAKHYVYKAITHLYYIYQTLTSCEVLSCLSIFSLLAFSVCTHSNHFIFYHLIFTEKTIFHFSFLDMEGNNYGYGVFNLYIFIISYHTCTRKLSLLLGFFYSFILLL